MHHKTREQEQLDLIDKRNRECKERIKQLSTLSDEELNKIKETF